MTPASAREELAAILEQMRRSAKVSPEDRRVAAANLRETWTWFAAHSLYFFTGAVGIVLLIACVNTAGLLLTRGLARQKEFAVRRR